MNNSKKNQRRLQNVSPKGEIQQRQTPVQTNTEKPNQAVNLMSNLGSGCSWDQLMGLYQKMAEGVVEFAEAVNNNLQLVVEAGKADRVFNNLILAAIEDSANIASELAENRRKHENRSGLITQPDDLVLYYSVGDIYNAIWQRFQTLSFQTATEITAYLSDVVTTTDKAQNVEAVVTNVIQNSQNTTT